MFYHESTSYTKKILGSANKIRRDLTQIISKISFEKKAKPADYIGVIVVGGIIQDSWVSSDIEEVKKDILDYFENADHESSFDAAEDDARIFLNSREVWSYPSDEEGK
jgi:hypothetical protein